MSTNDLMKQILDAEKKMQAARSQAEYARALAEYECAQSNYNLEMNDYEAKVEFAKAEHKKAMEQYKRECDYAFANFGEPPTPPQLVLPPRPVKRDIVKPQPPVVLKDYQLPDPVDSHAILSQYDLKKVEHSAFDYFQAVRSVADKMLYVLDDIFLYEVTHPEDCPTFTSSLSSTYDAIAKRQEIITQLFEQLFNRSADTARLRLLTLKNGAVSSSARIENASTIEELTALEKKPRVDFNLIVEQCVRRVNDALLFERHRRFIMRVAGECSQWSRAYENFRGNMYRTDDIWHGGCLNWRHKVERMLLPLLEYVFENGLALTDETIRTFERGLAILKVYRGELINVYNELEYVNMHWDNKLIKAQEKLPAIKERCWRQLEDALIGADRREKMFLVRWMGELIE